MFSYSRLAQELWVEVVDMTCYLLNWSLTSTLPYQTLFEALFGKKHSLSHIKFFVCDAFIHILKEKRSKLDNKVVKYIFIAYKYGIKGYKLWNLETKSISSKKNVVFIELKNDPRNKVT